MCCEFWICFSFVVHFPLFYIKVLSIGLRFLSRPCKFWKYFFIQGIPYISSLNNIEFCSYSVFQFLQMECVFRMICIVNIPQYYQCISSVGKCSWPQCSSYELLFLKIMHQSEWNFNDIFHCFSQYHCMFLLCQHDGFVTSVIVSLGVYIPL